MEDQTKRDTASRLTAQINLDNLQGLQDSFSKVTNTASIITDIAGNTITKPSNFCQFCNLVKSTQEGRRRCALTGIINVSISSPEIRPVFHRCGTCDLLNGSAPIFIGEDHVANWLFGQSRDSETSRDRIKTLANEIGVDETELLAAFDEIPVIDMEQYESAMELLVSITNGMSQLAYRNKSLTKEIQLRKETEKALSDSEIQFRRMVERNPLGIHMYHLDDEGRLVFEGANAAASKILGTSHTGFIGRTIEEAFPPLVETEIPNAYKRAAAEGVGYQTEHIVYEYERISGAFSVTAFQTGSGRMAAFFDDITERKQTEAMLKASERRYRELINALIEGVLIVDRSGRIVFANAATAAILGKDIPEKLLSESIFDLFPESETEKLRLELERDSGVQIPASELSINLSDGSKRVILASASPRLDDEGNRIGSVGTLLDITETKRLQEQSERAARLEAAGRIAAQVAHDFNNLLGPLLAYPTILQDYVAGDTEALAMLSDIRSAANRIADINNDLLSLGRRETKGVEPVDIPSLIDETIRQTMNINENIQIEHSTSSAVSPLVGSRSQLYRVLSNLIVNAADALGDFGRIEVDARDVHLSDYKYGIDSIPPGSYVAVSIRDNGSGIPEETLPRIFEPFFTTKSSDAKRGTGLGLSVVHALVKDHNGYIDCETAVDAGTCFTVYLPLPDGAGDRDILGAVSGVSDKVLVVDDDSDHHNLMKRILERYGYSVECVSSGEEAIDMVDEFKPDILVLDILMKPGIDGADTYRIIREHKPDIKAIVVSAFAHTTGAEKAQSEGVEFFLRKPVSPSKLLRALRRALDTKPAASKSV